MVDKGTFENRPVPVLSNSRIATQDRPRTGHCRSFPLHLEPQLDEAAVSLICELATQQHSGTVCSDKLVVQFPVGDGKDLPEQISPVRDPA